MKKMRFNYDIDIYKPGKSPGLWRYFIRRNRRNEGALATTEWLTKDGTWSEQSMGVVNFRSEKEAKEFAEKHVGPQVTYID